MLFIKEKELEILENEYNKTHSSIVLIKGNYKIGKTTLVNEFIKKENIEALYFQALEEYDKSNRDSFRTTVLDYCELPCLRDEDFSWDLSFRCFINSGTYQNKKVIIIDDIQYLIRNNHLFLRILLDGYTKYFKEKNVLLILTGNVLNNSIEETFKEEDITSIVLEQLDYVSFIDYYGTDAIELYSLTNGMPFYMQYFKGVNLIEDIKDTILNRNHILFNYPLFELKK